MIERRPDRLAGFLILGAVALGISGWAAFAEGRPARGGLQSGSTSSPGAVVAQRGGGPGGGGQGPRRGGTGPRSGGSPRAVGPSRGSSRAPGSAGAPRRGSSRPPRSSTLPRPRVTPRTAPGRSRTVKPRPARRPWHGYGSRGRRYRRDGRWYFWAPWVGVYLYFDNYDACYDACYRSCRDDGYSSSYCTTYCSDLCEW